MKIYVGNLPYTSVEDELQQVFEAYGQVDSVVTIKDRDTGVSKGFGFVEMPNDEEAKAAMAGLNGKDFKGRTLNVNEARSRGEGKGGGRRF